MGDAVTGLVGLALPVGVTGVVGVGVGVGGVTGVVGVRVAVGAGRPLGVNVGVIVGVTGIVAQAVDVDPGAVGAPVSPAGGAAAAVRVPFGDGPAVGSVVGSVVGSAVDFTTGLAGIAASGGGPGAVALGPLSSPGGVPIGRTPNVLTFPLA